MTTIMALAVKLTADAQKYTKTMANAERTAKKFSSGVSKSLAIAGKGLGSVGKVIGNTFMAGARVAVQAVQKIGRAALKAAKVAVGAFAAIGVAAVALGTKSFLAAAKVDELKIVNEVLAKNAGLALKAVRAEAKEVKGMGIEAATAESIVSEFIKAELDLAKASDIARIAQDAAVISQTNSSESAAAITLGIAKMNPLILRNQGIIVDAVAAYDKYAAANDLVAADLTKAQKQQAFLNAVIEQGEKIAGSYAAAMKEPGKVLRSLPRHFNEIFVAIGQVLKPLFGESVFAISDFVKKIEAAVEEGGALRPVIEGIAKALEPLGKLFKNSLESVDFAEVAQRMTPFVEGLGKVIQVIADLSTGETDLGTVFGNMLNSAKSALAGFDLGEEIANIFGPNLISALLSMDLDIGTLIGSLFAGIFSNQGKFLEIGLDIINSLLTGITGAIPKLAETALKILSALVQFITVSLPELITAAIPMVLALVDGILQALPLIIEAALQIIISLAMGLAQALPTLIPTIVEVLLKIVNVIIENLPMIIEAALALIIALAEGIITALPVLIAALPQIIIAILEALIDALPLIFEAAGELIGMLVTGIVANIPLVVVAIGELVIGVMDVMKGWPQKMQDSGKALLDGLWRGITDNAGKFWSNIVGFVEDTVQRIKDTLGQNSPSTVGIAIGADFFGSIGLGVENALSSVKKVMGSAIGEVALSPVLAGATPRVGAGATGAGARGGGDSDMQQLIAEFRTFRRGLSDDIARSNRDAIEKLGGRR